MTTGSDVSLRKNRFMNFNRFLKLTEDEEDKEVCEAEKYFKISSVTVNERKLISMNEVNGIDKETGDEVKLALRQVDKHQWFNYKFHDVWANAVLAGTKKVVVAVHSESGHILDITSIDASNQSMKDYMKKEKAKIPVQIRRSRNSTKDWDPDECLLALHGYLTSIKETLSSPEGEAGTVACFTFSRDYPIPEYDFMSFTYKQLPKYLSS